jgi:hypothetical protein
MKYFWLIFFVVNVFFGSCKKSDKIVIPVFADELIIDCKRNSSSVINKKYDLQIIQITGEILYVSYPKEGHLFFDKFSVTFGKLDDDGHLSNSEVYIECSFDNDDNLKYDLSEGSQITLVGYFDTYSNFLFKLKHCKIFQKF